MAQLDPNPSPALIKRRAWYAKNKRRLNEARAADRTANRKPRKTKADNPRLYLRKYWSEEKGYAWQLVACNPLPGDVEYRRVGVVHGPLAAPRHDV